MGAPLKDDVEQKMTPAQIAEAQKIAREYVRKRYKRCWVEPTPVMRDRYSLVLSPVAS